MAPMRETQHLKQAGGQTSTSTSHSVSSAPPSIPEPAATSGTHTLWPEGSACSHIARDSVLPLFTEQINTFSRRHHVGALAASREQPDTELAHVHVQCMCARVNSAATPVRWQRLRFVLQCLEVTDFINEMLLQDHSL